MALLAPLSVVLCCIAAISEPFAQAQSTLPAAIPTVEIEGDVGTCISSEQRANALQTVNSNIRSILSEYIIPECGEGLWYRVAYLNMSDSSQSCPSTWMLYSTPVRTCGRPTSTGGSTAITLFSTGRQYRKVCGRLIAYQIGSPDAFSPSVQAIDQRYIDGISITHGTPRNHIWSFVAGVTESSTNHVPANCPCSTSGSPGPQSFVGESYFCESGNPTTSFVNGMFYEDDPLWDGQQCGNEGTCCTDKSPPWFSVELTNPTMDDIEVRIIGSEGTNNEDTPVELLQMYVQ